MPVPGGGDSNLLRQAGQQLHIGHGVFELVGVLVAGVSNSTPLFLPHPP